LSWIGVKLVCRSVETKSICCGVGKKAALRRKIVTRFEIVRRQSVCRRTPIFGGAVTTPNAGSAYDEVRSTPAPAWLRGICGRCLSARTSGRTVAMGIVFGREARTAGTTGESDEA